MFGNQKVIVQAFNSIIDQFIAIKITAHWDVLYDPFTDAMLLLLGLSGGANSTLLVSSINTLLTYLQVNSTLLFTSNDTIVFI